MENKSKPLHPLQKCVSAAVLPTFSPVTNLTFVLDELSTNSNSATPRRRISWSRISESESSGTDSPIVNLRSLTDESDPQNPKDCAFSIKSRGFAFRRLKSMPASTWSPAADFLKKLDTLKENVDSSQKSTLSEAQDAASCDSGICGEKDDWKDDDECASSTSPIVGKFCKFSSRSLSSTSSSGFPEYGSDDGFLDVFNTDMDEDTQFPSGIGQLLRGQLPTNENVKTREDSLAFLDVSPKQKLLSNILSLKNTNIVDTPKRNCMRGLFRSPSDPTGNASVIKSKFEQSVSRAVFKRPQSPHGINSPFQSKRSRLCCHGQENCMVCTQKAALQRQPNSETEAIIKTALQKSTKDSDLVGDFSRPFSLPLVKGKHQDLKCISPETVADLIQGKFHKSVSSYKIIDCRYPYEYNGGHVKEALNYYTHEQIEDELLAKCNPESESNGILIFHCEFSSERAPKLLRYLRNKDREEHQETYPSLFYPEVYLLEGGYKAFFELHQEICSPQRYVPMLDKEYESDLRIFRVKSRSWTANNKARQALRLGMKI